MGAQQYCKPRDVQDVLEVENATSRRRAHCREDIRPFSGGGVSTLCLEVEELSAAVMADWSWEPTSASSSQQASPLQSSPLQSSSSQSSHEAMPRTSHENMRPPLDVPGMRANSSRTSLVETLLTCLTSLPPGSSNASEPASPTRCSMSDPSGAAPPAMRQSRSSGALSGSTSKASLGPTKPTKRRSRASRRVPTTVLESSCGDFRNMVQRLTGIPASTPPSPAPVRPQAQRAAPTYIRPDRALPSASVISPASVLNFTAPTTHPSFDDLRHSLHPSSSELQFTPLRSSNVKHELEVGTSVNTHFSMPGSIMTTRALSAPTSWWDPAPSHQINLPSVSSSSLANEIIVTSGPPIVNSSTAGLIGLQEDINELSMSQFDAWLSGDDH